MASKRALRRKDCKGKVRFADQTAAVAAMISLKCKGDDSNIRSYRCRKGCKGWHIGHFNPARPRA